MGTKRRREGRREHHLLCLARAGLLVGLSGAAACTVFDGLSVPPPAGSSSSSSSGAGGAGETGGAGGVATSGGGGTMSAGGAGGAGGSGGATGAGGAGGSNGSGGAGGAPQGPVTFLQLSEAARVCGAAFTCPLLSASIAASIGVPVDDTNYSQCMTWLAAPLPARPGIDVQMQILACIAASTSCAEAGACLPVEQIAPADPACAVGSKCIDASTALDCTTNAIYHCSTPGFAPNSACQTVGATAQCVTGACNMPDSAVCSGALAACTTAGLVETPCDVAGLSCAQQPGQPAACVGAGACASPGTSTCQGSLALACGAGVSSTFDCGAIGEACLSEVIGEARCGAPAPACTPTSAAANVCAGNKKSIDVCVGGSIVNVACPAGKICKPAMGGKTPFCG